MDSVEEGEGLESWRLQNRFWFEKVGFPQVIHFDADETVVAVVIGAAKAGIRSPRGLWSGQNNLEG